MPSRFAFLFTTFTCLLSAQPVFNVKDYGATGTKSDNARPALQQAIDACGKAGGGTVYVGPGEYTSGQLHLRSGVRLYLEAGATLFASLDGRAVRSSAEIRADLRRRSARYRSRRPRHAGWAIHL